MMLWSKHRIQISAVEPDSVLRLFASMGFSVDAARALVPFGEAGQILELGARTDAAGIAGLTTGGVRIEAGVLGMAFQNEVAGPPVTEARHSNGVRAVCRVIAVANVPLTEGTNVVNRTGAALTILDDGVDLDLGGLGLRIIGPGRARKVFPDYRHNNVRQVAFIGLTFVAHDMAAVEQHLKGGGIEVLRTPNGHFYLPAKVAFGVYVTFMAIRH